ncbi:hypothetical protein FHY55_07045 [Oceanicola sp. D3]|uniref:hypothetical protein n=1 Tax=Oceanicola sp. D3 TaxID=2587163 RepID=UPI00111CA523|nr:hypothetical protein [Oceanicola sp. D3]QDC09015.1 hypothetical protein FHY55_07045 [Oceanicola sp. D3]
MIPPEGFAENLLLLKGRMERYGGLRELAAWLDGWNSHRLHGGGPDPEGSYFFNHFERFVREAYPEAGLKSWDDILTDAAGGDREGVALFYELFDRFGPAQGAKERLAEKSSHGPGQIPRPKPAPKPRPAAPAKKPGRTPIAAPKTFLTMLAAYRDAPETRPGDGSLEALHQLFRTTDVLKEVRVFRPDLSQLTMWMQYYAERTDTTDWDVLMAPMTDEGEDPFTALLRVATALERRERDAAHPYIGTGGYPVIPARSHRKVPGMPLLLRPISIYYE